MTKRQKLDALRRHGALGARIDRLESEVGIELTFTQSGPPTPRAPSARGPQG